MDAKTIRDMLGREPFVPLVLTKTDGRKLDVPFRHVLVPMKSSAILFKGVESATSHFAREGYEHVNYDAIERLEPARRGTGKSKNGRGKRGKKISSMAKLKVHDKTPAELG
jgi:hypothetical protein